MEIYNKDYADAWIKHSESSNPIFRENYLYPYMKKAMADVKANALVLDIGCGWGAALNFLDKSFDYHGIDPTKEFFGYIKSKYADRKITLKEGSLPLGINVPDNYFDAVLCSMTLHCTGDLENSVKTIFSKAKNKAKVIITDLNDEHIKGIRKYFIRMDEDRGSYIRGLYDISKEVRVELEAYLYKEGEIENQIKKYGQFKKEILGPAFVGYDCVKISNS